MAKILLARLGVVLWVVVICFLSFSPLDSYKLPSFFSADKIAHICMYFVLVCLLFYASNSRKAWNYGIAFALSFSIVTELIQHFFIENRHGEIGDFFANFIGLASGYLIFQKRIKT